MPLVVGNVATAAGARWLAALGVDAVKLALVPAAAAAPASRPPPASRSSRPCARPGLAPRAASRSSPTAVSENDKDIFLAIACGASMVMLGSLLSGTDEAPGMIVEDPATRQKMKLYRGMTSPEAVTDGVEDRSGRPKRCACRPRASPCACRTSAA